MQETFRNVLDVRTRFATPGRNVEREGTERNEGVFTLLLTIASVQNNAWPTTGSAIALVNYLKLLPGRGEDEGERRRRRDLAPEPSSTLNSADQFQNTRPHSNILIVTFLDMSSSEDDSDVPEQVSLSASKKRAVGRKKDVANELAKAKLKRKELNQERDRQLKERSSKQKAEPIIDEEENSSGEDEELNDPRLLPDHLFAAAFKQPSPVPVRPAPKDAHPKIQKKRKRAHLTPKDKMIGRVSPPGSGVSG